MRIFRLIIFTAFLSISAAAQTGAFKTATEAPKADLTETETQLLDNIKTAWSKMAYCGAMGEADEKCRATNYAGIYRDAMGKAASYPKVLNALFADAASDYAKLGLQVKSAPQASQIADEQNAGMLRIIVVQNQRIIELLEKLAAKK